MMFTNRHSIQKYLNIQRKYTILLIKITTNKDLT